MEFSFPPPHPLLIISLLKCWLYSQPAQSQSQSPATPEARTGDPLSCTTGEPLVTAVTVLGASRGVEPALLSCIAPCRFLPLFFAHREGLQLPAAFLPLQLQLIPQPCSTSQGPGDLQTSTTHPGDVFDGGTCPCSHTLVSHLTPAVLCPSSVDWEGQPGPCQGLAPAAQLTHPK